MAFRFLAGVALAAAGATVLVKRYRRQLESGGTAIAAETAAQPVVHSEPAPALTRRKSAPSPTSQNEVMDSSDAAAAI